MTKFPVPNVFTVETWLIDYKISPLAVLVASLLNVFYDRTAMYDDEQLAEILHQDITLIKNAVEELKRVPLT